MKCHVLLLRAIVVLGAGTLASCASLSVPELDRTVPAHWDTQAGSETGHAAPAADLRHWWKIFSDPQLDHIILEALDTNLDLKSTRLRLKAARSLEQAARARFKPTLSFKADNQAYLPVDATYFEVGFDAEWELGLFGQKESFIDLAQAQGKLVEYAFQSARVSLLSEVARTYLAIRTTQAKIAILAQISTSEEKMLELTGKRREWGLASTQDESALRAEHADTLAELSQMHQELEAGFLRLALLLGHPAPDPEWRQVKAIPRLAPFRIGSEPASLLRTRPEILEAEQRVLLAASRLGLAKSELYPQVALGGFIGISSKINGSSLVHPNEGVYFGPSIQIPLFDWGRRKAVVEARDAELSAALVEYRQAVMQGVSGVQGALSRLHFTRAQVNHLSEVAEARSGALRSVEKLIDLRLRDNYARAEAQKQLALAKLQLTEAKYREFEALIALYKALGGAPPLSDMADS